MAGIKGMPTGQQVQDTQTPSTDYKWRDDGGMEYEGYFADLVNEIRKPRDWVPAVNEKISSFNEQLPLQGLARKWTEDARSAIGVSARLATGAGESFDKLIDNTSKAYTNFSSGDYEAGIQDVNQIGKNIIGTTVGLGGAFVAGPLDFAGNAVMSTVGYISPEAEASLGESFGKVYNWVDEINSKYLDNTFDEKGKESFMNLLLVGAVVGGAKGVKKFLPKSEINPDGGNEPFANLNKEGKQTFAEAFNNGLFDSVLDERASKAQTTNVPEFEMNGLEASQVKKDLFDEVTDAMDEASKLKGGKLDGDDVKIIIEEVSGKKIKKGESTSKFSTSFLDEINSNASNRIVDADEIGERYKRSNDVTNQFKESAISNLDSIYQGNEPNVIRLRENAKANIDKIGTAKKTSDSVDIIHYTSKSTAENIITSKLDVGNGIDGVGIYGTTDGGQSGLGSSEVAVVIRVPRAEVEFSGSEGKLAIIRRPVDTSEIVSIKQVPKIGNKSQSATNPDDILNSKVGSLTKLGKPSYASTIKDLMAVGLNESEALSRIDKRLAENKQMSRNANGGSGGAASDFKLLREANALRSTVDKDFSYDSMESTIIGQALKNLEDEGLIEKTLQDDGLYSFQLLPSAKKYLTPEDYTTIMKSGGLKHYPIDLYEGIVSKPKKVVEVKVSDGKVKLENIDNELGRPNLTHQASKNIVKELKNDIDSIIKSGIPPTQLFKDKLAIIGERLNIDTSKILDWNGDLYSPNLESFLKQLDASEKFGFAKVAKLTIPKDLNSLMRRDSQVAKLGFKDGQANQKAIDNEIIRNLKEEQKAQTFIEKIKTQAKIDTINKKNEVRQKFKNDIIQSIKDLPTLESDYKFYGTSKDANEIAGKFAKRIQEVSTEHQFNKVMDSVTQAIESKNIEVLKGKIESILSDYRIKQGRTSANKKQMGVQERMMLEIAAKGWKDVTKGMNSSGFKKVLDDITSIKELGEENFLQTMKVRKADIEAIVKEGNMQGGVQDGIGNLDEGGKMSQLAKYMMEKGLNPAEILLTTVKGNTNHPLWRAFSELSSIQNGILYKSLRFKEDVLGKLDEAGLLNEQTMRDLDVYGLTHQSDWDKNIYTTKNGEKVFTGNKIFKGENFANEAEYLAFVKQVNKRVDGNIALKEAYEYVRKMYDDTWEKANAAALIHDGAGIGKVDGYWKGKQEFVKTPSEYGTYIPDKGFDKGWQQERVAGKDRTYDLDFQWNVERFIDSEVRYADIRGQYQLVKDLIDNGIMDGVNTTTQDIVNRFLQDYSKAGVMESNVLSKGSSVVTRNILAGRLTTILSQPFSIIDATLYASGKNLRKATAIALKVKKDKYSGKIARALRIKNASEQFMKEDIFARAMGASNALKVAFDFDYATAEGAKVGTTNSLMKVNRKLTDTLLIPLSKVDLGTKYVTWLAAYADKFAEVTGKDFDMKNGVFDNKQAITHADMMMQLAIGSKDVAMIPPVLRSGTGRAILALQSFVLRRFGQLAHRLPDEYKRNPQAASKVYALMAATTIGQMMVSPLWNEFMEALGFKEDKDIKDRLTGMKDSEVSDVIVAVAKKFMASNTPFSSNIVDITEFGGTGLSVASVAKKAYVGLSTASQSLGTETPQGKLKEREFLKAGVDTLGAASQFVGGYPLQVGVENLRKKVKARKETLEYKKSSAKEKADYIRKNADELRDKAKKKARIKYEEAKKASLK